ncbi:MAG: ankyrin repeat domain-containing protein [Candidatus Cardinium sp.]|nr:ankyrin repeat domain-containing protein [Candidatus Cardinium sp.]
MQANKIHPKLFVLFIFTFLHPLGIFAKKSSASANVKGSHEAREDASSKHTAVEKNGQNLITFIKAKGKKVSVDDTLIHNISNNLTLQEVKALAQTDLWNPHIRYVLFAKVSYWYMLGQSKGREKEFSKKQLQIYRTILDFIYKQGIDINDNTKLDSVYPQLDNGNTLLMQIISNGSDLVNQTMPLLFLRTFKADPFVYNYRDKKNVLHFLLLKGHNAQQCVINAIQQHPAIKAHINDQTIYGDTALHLACVRRDLANIKQLLKHGAKDSLHMVNKIGKKPVDMLLIPTEERMRWIYLYLGFDNLSADYFNSSERLAKYLKLPLLEEEKKALSYVATIDEKKFNADPNAIEAILEDTNKDSPIHSNVKEHVIA